MDFKSTIDDLGQIYTLGVRYGGPHKVWNIRYIYTHKTDQLLDMWEDDHYAIFESILPDRLKKAFLILLSTLPEGEEGRENMIQFPIYEEDLAQFGELDNLVLKQF